MLGMLFYKLRYRLTGFFRGLHVFQRIFITAKQKEHIFPAETLIACDRIALHMLKNMADVWRCIHIWNGE